MLTSIPGDFNHNDQLDEPDINLLFVQLRSANPDLSYDLNEDGKVDVLDRDELILKIFGTTYGDANLDMFFDSTDFVQVFQRGQYEDGVALNSEWGDGDWDGNGEFDSLDFVLAFTEGGYEQGYGAEQPIAQRNRVAAHGPVAAQPILVAAALAPLPSQNQGQSGRTQIVAPVSDGQPASDRPTELIDEAIRSLFQEEDDSWTEVDELDTVLDEALLQDGD